MAESRQTRQNMIRLLKLAKRVLSLQRRVRELQREDVICLKPLGQKSPASLSRRVYKTHVGLS